MNEVDVCRGLPIIETYAKTPEGSKFAVCYDPDSYGLVTMDLSKEAVSKVPFTTHLRELCLKAILFAYDDPNVAFEVIMRFDLFKPQYQNPLAT